MNPAAIVFCLATLVASPPQEHSFTTNVGDSTARWSANRRDDGTLSVNGAYLLEAPDRGVRTEGKLRDARRTDTWTTTNTSEQGKFVAERANFVRGVLHGDYERRVPPGRLESKGRFRSGLRSGAWEDRGQQGAANTWTTSVDSRAVGALRDGRRHGPWQLYWPNGERMGMGPYYAGEPIGEWTFFTPSGAVDPLLERVRMGGSAWGVLDGDESASHSPPLVSPLDLRELAESLWPREQLADPNSELLEYADAGEKSRAAQLVVSQGRRGVLGLVRFWLTLDLEQPLDRLRADAIESVVRSMFGDRGYEWPLGVSAVDLSARRLALARWCALFSLNDRPEFWALDLAVMANGLGTGIDRSLHDPFGHTSPRSSNTRRRAERRSTALAASGTREAIRFGLEWLKWHQHENGMWRAKEFPEHCGRIAQGSCDGVGEQGNDIGVTALAALALLGDANTVCSGDHASSTAAAIAYLIACVDPETGELVPPGRPIDANRADADARAARAAPTACGVCRGSGSLTCSTCGGARFFPGGGPTDSGASPGTLVPCPACAGRGVQDCGSCTGGVVRLLGPTASRSAPQASERSSAYSHAIGTLALCEAAATCDSVVLPIAAQKAVERLLASRNPYGAWSYAFPPSGENRTLLTAWSVLALWTARDAGLKIDEAAFAGAMSWIDEATDIRTGRVGYDAVGTASNRIPRINDRFIETRGEVNTAAGLLCRFVYRQHPSDTSIMRMHAELIRRKLPDWNVDPKREAGTDYCYWFFGSHALRQGVSSGTADLDYWRKWLRSVESALVKSQRKDGDARGSWDAAPDPWGYTGGRVYATAMAILSLQAAWRDPEGF